MKTIVRIVLLAVLTTATTYAFAQAVPGVPRVETLKHWGLNDDQAKQVANILTKQEVASQAPRAQIKVLRAQIEQAMVAPNTDIKAVEALVDKASALRADVEKQFLESAVQIHQIVGDALFLQLRHEFLMRHPRWEGMGPMDRRPGPGPAKP